MLNRGIHRRRGRRGGCLKRRMGGYGVWWEGGGLTVEGKGRRVCPMNIYVGSSDFIRLCRPTADDVCSDGDICSTILIVATTKTSRHQYILVQEK